MLYFEIRGQDYVVEHDYADGVQSLAGRYPVASFGVALLESFLAGRTVVESDATTLPTRGADERAAFAAIRVRGHVDVPLVKAGAFVAGMTVHFSTPHEWAPEEVALIEQTAERTWAAVERARAEEVAREQDERLKLLLGHATDYAVIISDPKDRVLEWLGGAEAITGWRADEVMGQPVEIIFTPEDRAAGVPRDETEKAAATGRGRERAVAPAKGWLTVLWRGSYGEHPRPRRRAPWLWQSVPRRDQPQAHRRAAHPGRDAARERARRGHHDRPGRYGHLLERRGHPPLRLVGGGDGRPPLLRSFRRASPLLDRR